VHDVAPLAAVRLEPDPVKKPKQKYRGSRPNKPTKLHPLTRAELDSRTHAAKMWDTLSANIIAESGGESEITTVKKTLIDAFVGMAIRLGDLNTRGLLGEPVDLAELSLAASTLTRLAVRIGVERVARDVTTLSDYLKQIDAREEKGEEQATEVDQ
jgi:hypothetical protein